MHKSSIILYTITFIFVSVSCTLCFDHYHPLNPSVKRLVHCPATETEIPRTPLAKRSTDANGFKIDFTCYASNHTCQRARQAFERAGKIISQAITFTTPITVNATYVPFCRTLGECPKDNLVTLGGSYPARTVAIAKEDGIFRLYPQALVKQMQLDSPPAFAQYDIVSLFNAEAPFWFEDDGPIEGDQSDFLFVILHEFIHGLGFYSNWQEPVGWDALTPDLSLLAQGERLVGVNETSGDFVLTSALESAFDQYLVRLSDMQHTSNTARKFDTYKPQQTIPLVKGLQQTGLWDEAKAMYGLGTKANSLGFIVPNDSSAMLVLETGLSPFQSGSSISHVDYAMYGDSADFLMRYMQDRGLTLDQAMARSGSSSPIGPKLRKVLKTLGYQTIEYQPKLQAAVRINAMQSTGHKVLSNGWVFPMMLSCIILCVDR
ncbi:hypothetical protein BC943DRAFT_79324 [Umbelopsis sp. AD052]|nr:hypothetical protein BC943DRAFT_79324 [Umbelopsis sp. AD052]